MMWHVGKWFLFLIITILFLALVISYTIPAEPYPRTITSWNWEPTDYSNRR